MTDAAIIPTTTTEPKRPLSSWQRWLEFLQVIAVLTIASGIASPLARGIDSAQAWLDGAGFVIIGILIAYLPLGRIDIDSEIATDQKFEITPTRLCTLGETGAPPDVLDALRDMCDHNAGRWEGSGAQFRDDLYGRLGEKRGHTYLEQILQYLAVYVSASPAQSAASTWSEQEFVPNADTNVPVTSA